MSLSQYALELCALLVDETYGELSSRIFTILLRRGQLPVKDLMRHTHLTSKQLRHGLAVLIQQNLLYYNTDSETDITYYEANKDVAYALVRSGKIMQFVENKFGILTKEVVQNLLLLGHSKVSDLCNAYEAQKKEQSRLVDLARQDELRRKEDTAEDEDVVMNGHGQEINGANNHPPVIVATTGQLHTVLFRLFDAGLIERVVGSMFESPSDVQTKIERELTQEGNGNLKTPKTKEELTKRLLGRLRKDRAGGSEWRPQKRPHNGDHRNGTNGTSKRRRLSSGTAVNGDQTYEDEDDGVRLDDHLIIRVNHEKFKVLLRNAQLVHLCEHKIGKTTSRIYAHLLQLMESQIQRCQLDRHHKVLKDDPYIPPTVQTIMIASTLDKDIDPGFGVGKEPAHKERTPAMKLSPNRKRNGTEALAGGKGDTKKKVNGFENHKNGHNSEADDGSDQDSDDPFAAPPVRLPKRQKVTFQDDALFNPPRPEDREDHLMQVRKHLDLLQSSECKFVTRHDTNDCYTVDFENIVRFMQDAELDQLVYESFGVKGHRLVRIMKQMGKMEEKSLDKLALMKPKDARTKLSEMQMSGIVEIQEVPKDATNRGNNQRIIFLWFFDHDRVRQVVLDKIYKTMSRLLQRLAVERRAARHVLELTERSDLQHIAPDTYLDQQQIAELRVIEQKEATLMGQVARLDDMIGIFRDF